MLSHILTFGAASASTLTAAGQSGLRSLAIAIGGGLGAIGAGVGIGMIFSKVIESVTRQPEMRAEITSIQWLGFALTEAIFFYGLVAGLLAFVL
jgi:F-type H+-transporting ATPase subunit c